MLPILQGPEFIYQNVLQEINLADFGYTADKFWPGALKSRHVDGKLYGIPTNNETMAIMYNMDMFQKAGLDPMKGPDTWEDVKNYSKQIKDKTGKSGLWPRGEAERGQYALPLHAALLGVWWRGA